MNRQRMPKKRKKFKEQQLFKNPTQLLQLQYAAALTAPQLLIPESLHASFPHQKLEI